MGLFSEGFEEEIYELKQRIELLESYLRAIKEISGKDLWLEDGEDFYYELNEINDLIKEIPNL